MEWIKHIIEEGSRFHVIYWDTFIVENPCIYHH